jgi:hypothetical protein
VISEEGTKEGDEEDLYHEKKAGARMRRREEERASTKVCAIVCDSPLLLVKIGRFERGRKRPTSRCSVERGYNVPLQLTEDSKYRKIASTGGWEAMEISANCPFRKEAIGISF